MLEQESETSENESDVDFENFYKMQDKYESVVQHGRKGLAKLNSCDIIDKEEVPSEYDSQYKALSDKYFKFEAELTGADRKVTVLCPAVDRGKTVRWMKEWTNSDEIYDLAGKRVPIRHVNEDVYRVETFSRNTAEVAIPDVHPNIIRRFIEYDFLKFQNGAWKNTQRFNMIYPLLFTTMLMVPFFITALLPSMLSIVLFAGFLFGLTYTMRKLSY